MQYLKQILAWARESVVSEKLIKKGEKFTEENIWVKRPGPKPENIPAKEYKKILGKFAKKDIEKDTQIKREDVN